MKDAGVRDPLSAGERAHELEKRKRLVVADRLGEHLHKEAMRDDRDPFALGLLDHAPRVPDPLANVREILRAVIVP